jgi:hypothetical protein
MASGSSNRAILARSGPTELIQQTGRRRERRPEPIAHRDELDLACLVPRDQVLEVNLPMRPTPNAPSLSRSPFM